MVWMVFFAVSAFLVIFGTFLRQKTRSYTFSRPLSFLLYPEECPYQISGSSSKIEGTLKCVRTQWLMFSNFSNPNPNPNPNPTHTIPSGMGDAQTPLGRSVRGQSSNRRPDADFGRKRVLDEVGAPGTVRPSQDRNIGVQSEIK